MTTTALAMLVVLGPPFLIGVIIGALITKFLTRGR
jgi:hypothetical protein